MIRQQRFFHIFLGIPFSQSAAISSHDFCQERPIAATIVHHVSMQNLLSGEPSKIQDNIHQKRRGIDCASLLHHGFVSHKSSPSARIYPCDNRQKGRKSMCLSSSRLSTAYQETNTNDSRLKGSLPTTLYVTRQNRCRVIGHGKRERSSYSLLGLKLSRFRTREQEQKLLKTLSVHLYIDRQCRKQI